MSPARSAAALLCSLLLAGCADQLNELFGEEETPTPTPTATPTPTPEGDPTPISTTTVGDLTTFDFGTIDVPSSGIPPTLRFDAPADVIGLHFIAHGATGDRDKIFIFAQMITPSSVTVLNANGGGAVRQAANDGAMGFSLPGDDSTADYVMPGAYSFRVVSYDSTGSSRVTSSPRVLVKARTAPGATVPDGLIDLNVIVVDGIPDGSGDLTAAELAASGHWANARTEIVNDYATIGLDLGTVEFFDLTTAGFATIDGDDEMKTLIELSSQLQEHRVNLFIVDSLAGNLSGAAGVAGGVPIPMNYNGTLHSGVVVALQNTGNETGEVIAHEMGHSLGLYHTTEFNAAADPISDTPHCPNIATMESSCPDRTYVMFPRVTGVFSQFSAGQGTVVRSAMHVRPATSFASIHEPGPPEDVEPFEYWCEDGVLWKITP